MNIDQLWAFVAAVDAGALDGAARRLRITPSAVSQRIRALETATGSVLLRRTSPVAPTPAGGVILAAARQMLAVESEALERLSGGPGGAAGSAAGGAGGGTAGHGLAGRQERQVLRLAVNADSLATWLAPLLEAAAGWPDTLLHLEVHDQAEADGLLSDGMVMAAISSRRAAPAGCTTTALGTMRYRAMVHPELIAGAARAAELSADELRWLPVVDYGADDDLQRALLRRNGVRTRPPAHQVPGSREFVQAVRAGLGWGMIPDLQLESPETQLVSLPVADPVIDVPLYLHRWRVGVTRLDRACEAIAKLAAAYL